MSKLDHETGGFQKTENALRKKSKQSGLKKHYEDKGKNRKSKTKTQKPSIDNDKKQTENFNYNTKPNQKEIKNNDKKDLIDIKDVVERKYRGNIVETVFAPIDKDGKKRDFIHGLQFALKNNRYEDIYIYTDGSVISHDDTFSSGFGTLIQSKEKDIYTHGTVDLGDIMSKMNKDNYSSFVELLALENALYNLKTNFDYSDESSANLKNRNIYIYSDNLDNIRDISKIVAFKYGHKNNANNANTGVNTYSQMSDKIIPLVVNKKSNDKYKEIDKLKREIADFIYEYKINITWIRSHSNYRQNEIVDKLAKKGSIKDINNELSDASKINNVYGIHTFSSIRDKKEKFILPYLDGASVNQKVHKPETRINFQNNDQNPKALIYFHHKNRISSQTVINDIKLVVESDYRFSFHDEKVKYETLTQEDVKSFFLKSTENLQGKMMASNFNSSMMFLIETCKAKKFTIENLFFNTTVLEGSNFVENSFFNNVDNNFKFINPLFKMVDNMVINYTQPINEKINLKRIYDFVKDDSVYELSHHPNNELFKAMKTANLNVENNKHSNIVSIKETGVINENSTLLLRKNRDKLYLQQTDFFNDISKAVDKKISINPLKDIKRTKK